MRRALGILAIAAVLVSIPSLSLAKGNANFVIGTRTYDGKNLDLFGVDDQTVVGINVDFGKNDWPITLVIGAFTSSEDNAIMGFPFELVITELSFGVQKTWDQYSHARPYISGGLSQIKGEFNILLAPDNDDSTIAFFVDGGIFWRIGEGFNLGIGGRILLGSDVTFDMLDTDLDYTQINGVIGWGW